MSAYPWVTQQSQGGRAHPLWREGNSGPERKGLQCWTESSPSTHLESCLGPHPKVQYSGSPVSWSVSRGHKLMAHSKLRLIHDAFSVAKA